MSAVNSPTGAPVHFAPRTFSPVSPTIYPVAAPGSYAPIPPYAIAPYASYPNIVPVSYAPYTIEYAPYTFAPYTSAPFAPFTRTDYSNASWFNIQYVYVIVGAFVLLALAISALCRVDRRIVSSGGPRQPEQQQIQFSSQATRPSAPRTTTAASPSSAAPPSLEDVHRAKSLRAQVVQAIFPDLIVDSESFQYDVEADSFRWTNNKDADTTCSICIDRFKGGDNVIHSLCGHTFHRHCILGWSQIKSECPVCRQDMWDPKMYTELEKEFKAGAGQHWS